MAGDEKVYDEDDKLNNDGNFICSGCKRGLKSAIKCYNCTAAYHPSCAVRVKGIKVINYEEIACPACAEEMDTQNILKENEMLNQVILVMMENAELLRGKLRDLEEKLYNAENKSACTYSKVASVSSASMELSNQGMEWRAQVSSKHQNNGKTTDKRNNYPTAPENKAYNERQYQHKFTLSQVSSAIEKVYSAVESSETVRNSAKFVNEDTDNSNHDGNHSWQNVMYKRRRNQIVVGNNKENSNVMIKGVPRFMDLHVYRINPETTVSTMEQMLKANFPEVRCEQLDSGRPDLYSSFKVKIHDHHFKKAMDPTVWPEHACVSLSLYLKKNNAHQSQK